MDAKKDWDKILKIIDRNQKILITTHIHPDGDGLGSEKAIHFLLNKLGKDPFILNSDPLPYEYEFLNQDNIFNTYEDDIHSHLIDEYDLIMVLDIGSIIRLGPVGEKLKTTSTPVICIDHHPIRHDSFDYEIVDHNVSATAILLYELFNEYFPEYLNLEVAKALYTGILTDTGSFRFKNTDIQTMEIATELIKMGVVPGDIYNKVYENKLPEQTKLLGMVLQNINYELDGKIAWFKLTHDLLNKAGANASEVEGFTDFVRGIRGVEVAVKFMENSENHTRINFRSKGEIVINKFAKQFNGGGHPFAAGAEIFEDIETSIDILLPKLKDCVQKQLEEN